MGELHEGGRQEGEKLAGCSWVDMAATSRPPNGDQGPRCLCSARSSADGVAIQSGEMRWVRDESPMKKKSSR